MEEYLMYPSIPPVCSGKLLSHQIEHVETLNEILDKRDVAADVTKPGGGKTYSASCLAYKRRRPVMVFCPKSVINTWHKVLTQWGVPIISITNYDMARTSHSDTEVKWYDMRRGYTKAPSICPWMKKKRIYNQKEEFEFIVNIPYKVMIIIDEEHTGKNTHTQTFSLLKGLKKAAEKQGHECLYLSATPIEKKINLKSMLYFLGYVKKPDMISVNSYFRKVIGTTNITDIHSYLHNRERSVSTMPRPTFPEGVTNDVRAITIKMNDEKTKRIADLNKEILLARRGLAKKKCDNSIGLMNGNRQLVEWEKVDAIVDYVIEGLDNYRRIGIFVNYKGPLHAIKDKLLEYVDESEISLIYGELDSTACEEEAHKYNNGETRILIATIDKGGQSLSFHDIIGDQETLVIISPPTSATKVEQTCGRHFRAECKSRVTQLILFTAGDPIEESIRSALDKKLNDMLILTTGQGSDYKLREQADEGQDNLFDIIDIPISVI